MSIKLRSHGVNSSRGLCFFCGKSKDILSGSLPKDAEALHEAVYDHEPCDLCAGYMKIGIILIEIRDLEMEEEQDNPYRMGGFVVLKEEVVRRFLKEPLLSRVIEKRFCFISTSAWKALGLPKEEALAFARPIYV